MSTGCSSSSVPHLYPLAKLVENYPRYAAVMLDTNKARIFVFGVGSERSAKRRSSARRPAAPRKAAGRRPATSAAPTTSTRITSRKSSTRSIASSAKRTSSRSWSPAREVAVPLLREQLPKHLADKIVDDRCACQDGETNFVATTMAALREKDAETDIEKVQELMDAWRSGGLGVAGPEATLSAFQLGQVEELIITGSPETLKPVQTMPDDAAPGDVQVDTSVAQGSADEAASRSCPTTWSRARSKPSARIRFIEDASLLAESAAWARCCGSESRHCGDEAPEDRMTTFASPQRGTVTEVVMFKKTVLLVGTLLLAGPALQARQAGAAATASGRSAAIRRRTHVGDEEDRRLLPALLG